VFRFGVLGYGVAEFVRTSAAEAGSPGKAERPT
jgi:hypothetical protein